MALTASHLYHPHIPIHLLTRMTMKRNLFLPILLAPLCLTASAEKLRCTAQEAEIYRQNRNRIDSLLLMRYSEEVMKIDLSFYVPKEGHEKLEYFVKSRELKLICQDFLYRDSLERRVQNKLLIERVFRDSINTILIPAYSNRLSGENVSYALHCRKALGLDNIQYSLIMDKALDMARRIRRAPRTNVWNEEMEILKKTLDKRQLRTFFVNKNTVKVTDEFDKAWLRLKQAGLTEQIDSVKDVNDAINYLFSRQMVKDLYRHYGTSQKRYPAELDKNKPKIILLLNGLDKKERAVRKEETASKGFIW